MPKDSNQDAQKSWPKVDPRQSFPALEEEVLQYWQENKIFEESVARKPKKGDFVFYDGPPFATGLPHYGHILQSVIKDLVPRYKTMQGYRVPRRWGWDCHGLPVENLIEKELGLESKKDIETLGVAKFNAACEASVLRYADEWKRFIPRMGRWVDMENDYKTMNPEYMESVWWVFKSLWDKGLIYEGKKPMQICPRCVTPLSNFEVGLGYKDVTDLSAIAKFQVVGEENTYLLAWTTTPWTLPGNVALAVHPEVEYARVRVCHSERSEESQADESNKNLRSFADAQDDNISFWLAHELVEKVFGEKEIEILETKKGSELVGLEYEALFDYYKSEKENGAFRVVAADFVTTDSGTGIVHIAPAFGEDDMNVAKKENLPAIQHVTMEGRFTAEVTDFAGQEVKPKEDPRKTDQKIIAWLEERGLLFKSENYKHSYPHCWRCDTPLLNYATSSWFVAVEKIKDRLLANNEKINWIPDHVKAGRFGKWLEGARDWAISRNRYWGAPLPIWRCDTTGETVCIGSAEELEKLSGVKVNDFHKQFVDEITWQSPAGGTMRRIPEVLDCWFESGSMPYANQETFKVDDRKGHSPIPANFIAEAQDQTRGWFYTLHVLGTALFDKPAFENCITSGLILAEDGQKMSKSKKNYPDPNELIHKHGADAMRLYLMNSPVVRGEALRFSERGVEETLRGVLLPLWNTYYFFTTYATADGWKSGALPAEPSNKLDRWILSELNILIRDMSDALDRYELQEAVRPLVAFMDGLTNWYIRRSRRRFWRAARSGEALSEVEGKSESDTDKNEAYATLLHVLTTVSKLLAPVCPFISEEVYRGLTNPYTLSPKPSSVHLADWPTVDANKIDEELNEEVTFIRQIVMLGLRARANAEIGVRQPLQNLVIGLPDDTNKKITAAIKQQQELIEEELNVKSISFQNPNDIAKVIIAPNARVLGKKYPAKMKEFLAAAREGNVEILGEGKVKLCGEILDGTQDEFTTRFEPKTDNPNLIIESEGPLLIALDIALTPKLEREGTARDLVRVIQDLRKTADYAVSDRIELAISGADEIVNEWKDYICGETLAELTNNIDSPDRTSKLDSMTISIRRAG